MNRAQFPSLCQSFTTQRCRETDNRGDRNTAYQIVPRHLAPMKTPRVPQNLGMHPGTMGRDCHAFNCEGKAPIQEEPETLCPVQGGASNSSNTPDTQVHSDLVRRPEHPRCLGKKGTERGSEKNGNSDNQRPSPSHTKRSM